MKFQIITYDLVQYYKQNLALLLKEGLYRIWCCVNNTLGDSGVNTLGGTAIVNTAG